MSNIQPIAHTFTTLHVCDLQLAAWLRHSLHSLNVTADFRSRVRGIHELALADCLRYPPTARLARLSVFRGKRSSEQLTHEAGLQEMACLSTYFLKVGPVTMECYGVTHGQECRVLMEMGIAAVSVIYSDL